MTARYRSILALAIGTSAALALSACGPAARDLAGTKVVNGIVATEGMLKPVVQIVGDGGDQCTGTFLNSSVLLTAAHCVFRSQKIYAGGVASLEFGMAASDFSRFYDEGQRANWSGVAAEAFVRYDMALVRFPAGTAQTLGIEAFYPIERGTRLAGIDVFVTGFGESRPNLGDNNTKRWGVNRIDRYADGVIAVDGGTSATSGVDSHSSRGDSGGPLLYVGTTISGDETIVGTVSLVPNQTGPATAHYSAVQSPYARALFAWAIARGFEPFAY